MNELIDYLCRRYEVGPYYAKAYTDYWNNTGKTQLSSPSGLSQLRDPESMWFEFALSANQRGRQLVHALGAGTPSPGARYLDVGCGFGGMLTAFSEKGYEVHGIELDAVRVALAKENVRDIQGSASVTNGNILDPHFIAAQKPFDLITCIDVIEHVLDVKTTIAHAVSILRPGGTLHLEIPNMEAMGFIESDGHFSLYGVTLLPRWAAIEYQQAHLGYEYDVGDYYPLDYYVRVLESHGLIVEVKPSPLQSYVSWDSSRKSARNLCRRIVENKDVAVESAPARVRPYLTRALDAYSQVLQSSLESAEKGGQADKQQFVERFGALFWLVSARKPMSS